MHILFYEQTVYERGKKRFKQLQMNQILALNNP